jgi:NAD(P)-dependent dehydrogenase (short-subunit alcohol dehydrogenase family)
MQTSRIFQNDLLRGRVAVVTGGGTGIGAAVTRELTRLGATVVIASRKSDVIDRAAAGLTAELGRPVYAAACDIRDREGVRRLAREVVEKYGSIDILVNNGGGQFFSPADQISDKGFDAVIATNLAGTWNMTRAVADAWMLAHGGAVVSVTMLTDRAFPGMAHSHAARAGVEAMTRTLAVEWASRNVRLNCVAPGFVASSGIQRYPAGLDLISKMRSYVPMKRLATCDEVAWLTTFLVTEASAYITGQTYIIDGGKTLWGDWWPIPDPEDVGSVDIPVEPWEKGS